MNKDDKQTTNGDKGYDTYSFPFPTKRFYQALDLKDDPLLIEEYKKRHSSEHYWPEIGEGIRKVGILDMEIYLLGTRLVMVVETKTDFNWEEAFAELASLPMQSEWEEYMSVFQIAEKTATSTEKWQRMERIFKLP